MLCNLDMCGWHPYMNQCRKGLDSNPTNTWQGKWNASSWITLKWSLGSTTSQRIVLGGMALFLGDNFKHLDFLVLQKHISIIHILCSMFRPTVFKLFCCSLRKWNKNPMLSKTTGIALWSEKQKQVNWMYVTKTKMNSRKENAIGKIRKINRSFLVQ